MATVNRSVLVMATLGCVLVIGACGAGSSVTRAARFSSRTYRDSAGWSVSVPPGWHVVRFNDSSRGIVAAGALVSNVRLAAPPLVSGYPIQVNDRVLPGRGVGLIIATDSDPKLAPGELATPPLPSPEGRQDLWLIGSALAGEPFLETLWFRADGRTFIASAKVGPKVSGADRRALVRVISSLR